MTTPSNDQSPLLIVDDEPAVRDALARGLWACGYRCAVAGSGEEALARLRQGRFSIMLCDVRMPGMDGIQLLPLALRHDPDLSVIMVTALAGLDTAMSAIHAGACDYVTKPFQVREVEPAVRRALDHRRLRLENRRHVEHLEEQVQARTATLRRMAVDVVTSLGLTLEAKDPWTHDHSRRVSDLAEALGGRLGLDARFRDDLRLGGMLHDIGKIGVPERILHKDSALTTDEYREIKTHPELGARILSPLHDLEAIIPFIRHHHERWDGSSYPNGLSGESIPFGARIVGVADAYVAMRENRPYRRSMSQERTLTEIRIGARRQFDLGVVGALLKLQQDGTLDHLDRDFPQEMPAIRIA